MKSRSNWRSVRLVERRIERELHQRHSLRLHGVGMGTATLLLTWGLSHLQMVLGVESLAVRYLVSLGLGYLVYLGLLRWWAGRLLSGQGGGADVPDLSGVADFNLRLPGDAGVRLPTIHPGGGGDFAGAGASGDFSVDSASALAEPGGGVISGLANAAGDAFGGAADADEAAVVVIPVLAIFMILAALVTGAGALAVLYFGWEALLAVAVELSFSLAAANAAGRLAREGWFSAALRLTWKPLLGAVLAAVLLGATVDYFVPQAHSLPDVLRLLRAV